MITLHKYETQTFTDEQEQAISELNDAIAKHFDVMGCNVDLTEDVWNYIDGLITHEILNDYKED